MDDSNFVMRQRKRSVFFQALGALLFGTIASGMAFNWLEHTDESAYGDLIFIVIFIGCCLLAFLGLIAVINGVVWKCTVDGERIYYHGLLVQKSFVISDVEQVESANFFATMPWEFWFLTLTGQKRPLAVYPKAVNSAVFLAYLKSRKIPGANKL